MSKGRDRTVLLARSLLVALAGQIQRDEAGKEVSGSALGLRYVLLRVPGQGPQLGHWPLRAGVLG